jgi:hypothetical protein
MSSVTRFIRQIPVNASVHSATTVVGSPATYVYEFNPSASNVVGNYPPGYMTTASAALQAAITAAASAAGGAANLLLRDLGKSISAPIGSATGNIGFFRQVQIIAPASVASFNAGTFGVLGAANTPDALTDFMVVYVPISVMGVGVAPIPLTGPCAM